MKKIILIMFSLFFLLEISYSQDLLWEEFNDTNGFMQGHQLLVDDQNNVYVGAKGNDLMSLLCYDKDGNIQFVADENNVDRFSVMKSGNNGRICMVGSTDIGSSVDALLKVYNPDGSVHFTQTYDYVTKSDRFEDVYIDANNNIYACGYSYNTSIEQVALITKYDKDGIGQWVQQYEVSNRNCNAKLITVNDVGEVFIVGYDGPTSPGPVKLLVLKYNEYGSLISEYSNVLSGYDLVYPQFSLLDDEDNLFIGGYAYVTSSGPGDVGFLMKFSAGSLIWSQILPSQAGGGILRAAQFDQYGDIICIGSSKNTNLDGYYVKFSPTGGKIMEGNYNSPFDLDDGFNDLCIFEDYYYICGTSEGVGTLFDMIALKLNSEFELMWNIRYNSFENGLEYPEKIVVDGEENIIMTGVFQSATEAKCLTLKYANPLGIHDLQTASENDITVYPNPVQNFIHFTYKPSTPFALYNIFTPSGKIVQSGVLQFTQDQQLEIGYLDQGVYFLQILDGKKQYNAKFVKK